jgi:hypothetical protein
MPSATATPPALPSRIALFMIVDPSSVPGLLWSPRGRGHLSLFDGV